MTRRRSTLQKRRSDALTADQKQYLTAETISVINQAYEQVLGMDQNHVQWLIDDLPDEDKVTLADKKQINAAKAAYDALPTKPALTQRSWNRRLRHLKSWNRAALARTPATTSI